MINVRPQVVSQSVPLCSMPLSQPHDSVPISLRLEATSGRPTNSFPSLHRHLTLLEFEAGPTGEQLSAMTQRDWKLSFKKGKKKHFFAGTISRKQRSWKIVPKTPSGLHFELTDQKLSANYNTTLPNSSCCFHRSSDQSYDSPFPLFIRSSPFLSLSVSLSPLLLLSWQMLGINSLAYWCAVASCLKCPRSATHAFIHHSSKWTLLSRCLSYLKGQWLDKLQSLIHTQGTADRLLTAVAPMTVFASGLGDMELSRKLLV